MNIVFLFSFDFLPRLILFENIISLFCVEFHLLYLHGRGDRGEQRKNRRSAVSGIWRDWSHRFPPSSIAIPPTSMVILLLTVVAICLYLSVLPARISRGYGMCSFWFGGIILKVEVWEGKILRASIFSRYKLPKLLWDIRTVTKLCRACFEATECRTIFIELLKRSLQLFAGR